MVCRSWSVYMPCFCPLRRAEAELSEETLRCDDGDLPDGVDDSVRAWTAVD